MKQESLFVENKNYKLHLRHIFSPENPDAIPVLMLHGAIENGKIFYTEKGKGLACYLAKHGFDVYVADFRGRGESLPSIEQDAQHGQHECIIEDIPLLIDFVRNKNPKKLHLVCHSWGGVLAASVMVRFPDIAKHIASNLCFGTKRSISVKSVEKFFKVNLFWNRFAIRMAKKAGYLDARRFGVGSDNETLQSLQHSVAWVKRGAWIDPADNFDYKKASEGFQWPPTWHLTGVKDHVLGHAIDVKRFIDESNNKAAKFSLLSKAQGNKLDYDHINILTHADAVHDHFPKVAHWMKLQG